MLALGEEPYGKGARMKRKARKQEKKHYAKPTLKKRERLIEVTEGLPPIPTGGGQLG